MLKAKVSEFASLGEADRDSYRDRLSMDDFYTLWSFAHDRAVAALRKQDASEIQFGFIALAMIALERIDWRDVVVANDTLRYAGYRIGASIEELQRNAMKLAEPQTSQMMAKRGVRPINLLENCGKREVRTSDGINLVDSGFARYEPTVDLTSIAFSAAEALEVYGYGFESLEIGTELPLVWFDNSRDTWLVRILRRISASRLFGCASIHAVPMSDPEPMRSGQSLLVLLAEASNERVARQMADAAQIASNSDASQIGLASGRLFAVIIQRSWMADTPPIEDAASLERLRGAIESLLA
jgi:hypothetical protein